MRYGKYSKLFYKLLEKVENFIIKYNDEEKRRTDQKIL